jgi:hypothetical protein
MPSNLNMKSPFADRLSTNYGPINDEFEQITQLLIEPLNQLKDLDTEISRLQRITDELSIKRNQLADFITPHQALLSPIRRVPRDVLQEIFVRCLPTNHNAIMNHRDAPLLLGRVCSSWRSISISIPQLWSSIHISIPDPPMYSKEDDVFIQAVRDWLNRAGALPLSISLFQLMFNGGTSAKTEHDFVTHLISLSKRWKHINLSLSCASFPLFSSLSPELVPLLETCTLYLPEEDRRLSRMLENPCSVFQAPRLHGLSIPSLFASPDTAIDWLQLTELIITDAMHHRWQVNIALAIMSRCENLVSCTICLNDGFTSGDAPIVMVTMPLLETLSLGGWSNFGTFFDHLRLPSLLSFKLRVKHDVYPQEFDNRPLVAFLGRLTTLDSLTLSSSAHTQKTLTECIIQVPHVTKLRLDAYGSTKWGAPSAAGYTITYPLDDEVLGLLTPTPATTPSINKPLWPRLKVIESNATGVSDEALLKFIHARTTLSATHNVSRLDRVEFSLPRTIREGIFSIPNAILAEGTAVKVTYTEPYIHPPRSLHPRLGLDRTTFYPLLKRRMPNGILLPPRGPLFTTLIPDDSIHI